MASTAKLHAPIEAVLTAPVLLNGSIVVPAGTTLTGEIRELKVASKADERSSLRLVFDHLGSSKIESRVIEVDNAREKVDDKGSVQGILVGETLSARMDKGINKVSQRYPGLGELLASIKGGMVEEADPDIRFDRGTDLMVALTAPVKFSGSGGAGVAGIAGADEVAGIVQRESFRTYALKPPSPSDMTTLMFLGTADDVRAAFEGAGWTAADPLTRESTMETIRAVAAGRGYKDAPVSVLTLEGRTPEMVFQKQTDTFAKRHHIRIWRRPGLWDGKPIWVGAATHDIAIDFSEESRTFTHRIDPKIDGERAKVVSDLTFTGRVKGLALVERPSVPKQSRNATGDDLVTDGRMAVVLF